MKTYRKIFSAAALLPVAASAFAQGNQSRPNVLLIVADDLGKGDVSAYGSPSICTPNIDGIANQGLCFDNGYATSATSTPSRYALFTGMYPIRNPQAVILPGNAPLIIGENQPTMPKMFQAAGYSTAAIGKWHLGMGDGNIDWNQQISPCANAVGFDYTCVVAATNDRVPTVYVENGKVVGLDPEDPIQISYTENFDGEPTAITNPEMVKMPWHHGHNMSIVNGIPRIGYMKGGNAAKWKDDQMAEYFLGLAEDFVDSVPADKPFFLYYGLHQPHVPRVPNKAFKGKSGLGVRGDVILEADWCVGEILRHLDEKGLLENTIVVFTSDNGPVMQDGYYDGAADYYYVHDPNNGMRGGKYSLFDGGAHVPLFVMWKNHIKPGTRSAAFLSQMDFFASFASIIGAEMPEGTDSRDYSAAMLGKSSKGRDYLLLEAKKRLCYRRGDYVLIPPYKGKKIDKTGNEIGNLEDYALYDLKHDKHQNVDIKDKKPRLFKKMKAEFHELVGDWYSYDPKYSTEVGGK